MTMKRSVWAVLRAHSVLVLCATCGFLFVTRAECQTLHVYGPGGPSAPLEECADLFSRYTHIKVMITAGPEEQWIAAANADADVVYGGAEYMLTQFGLKHPTFLEDNTRVELYARKVAILVRPGNPKRIRSLRDLVKPGVRILDVSGAGQLGVWEDLAGREKLIPAFEAHIAVSVPNSAEAIQLWRTRPELDAWVTYASWQKRMPEVFTLVEIPSAETLLRGTPAAIAVRSTQKSQARQFLLFLQSPVCHAVFQRWGWE